MTITGESFKITDFIDVRKKLSDLRCHVPQKIGLLPINFEQANSVAEFLQASEAATVRKLLLAEAVPLEEIVDRSRRPPYVKNKSHEWVAPILFVSALWYSENQALVSIALDVVGNYATAFFNGMRGNRDVTLNIVVEKKNGTYKKIAYHGPADGLKDLAKVVHEVGDD